MIIGKINSIQTIDKRVSDARGKKSEVQGTMMDAPEFFFSFFFLPGIYRISRFPSKSFFAFHYSTTILQFTKRCSITRYSLVFILFVSLSLSFSFDRIKRRREKKKREKENTN